jgi:hypothetical protein
LFMAIPPKARRKTLPRRKNVFFVKLTIDLWLFPEAL